MSGSDCADFNRCPSAMRKFTIAHRTEWSAGSVASASKGRANADDVDDVSVVEGCEAGGHSGHRGTFTLVPEAANYLAKHSANTVLVAAGGIGDGAASRRRSCLARKESWSALALLPTKSPHRKVFVRRSWVPMVIPQSNRVRSIWRETDTGPAPNLSFAYSRMVSSPGGTGAKPN